MVLQTQIVSYNYSANINKLPSNKYTLATFIWNAYLNSKMQVFLLGTFLWICVIYPYLVKIYVNPYYSK